MQNYLLVNCLLIYDFVCYNDKLIKLGYKLTPSALGNVQLLGIKLAVAWNLKLSWVVNGPSKALYNSSLIHTRTHTAMMASYLLCNMLQQLGFCILFKDMLTCEQLFLKQTAEKSGLTDTVDCLTHKLIEFQQDSGTTELPVTCWLS